ncbi:MAG: DUF3568 family protein [Planctomycetota bacterium]
MSNAAKRSTPRNQNAWLPLLLSFVITLGGCAGGLEFAAIGAAASATQAGAAVVKGGKINAAVLVPADSVEWAVRKSIEDMGLDLRSVNERRAYRTEFILKDDRGAKIKVRIRERSETLTRIQIDVGWFGDAPTARLFAGRIEYHLRNNPRGDRNRLITDDEV